MFFSLEKTNWTCRQECRVDQAFEWAEVRAHDNLTSIDGVIFE
jgi:hypothetical protein